MFEEFFQHRFDALAFERLCDAGGVKAVMLDLLEYVAIRICEGDARNRACGDRVAVIGEAVAGYPDSVAALLVDIDGCPGGCPVERQHRIGIEFAEIAMGTERFEPVDAGHGDPPVDALCRACLVGFRAEGGDGAEHQRHRRLGAADAIDAQCRPIALRMQPVGDLGMIERVADDDVVLGSQKGHACDVHGFVLAYRVPGGSAVATPVGRFAPVYERDLRGCGSP
jgi:hypothetical protein